MGIFEAEVRGHRGEEDLLTSRVFGTLEILDKSKFLGPLLQQCGVDLGKDIETSQFVFKYWETAGKRTPDVILKGKSALIFIENKLDTPVDVVQLVEEYEDGTKTHKNFWLIAVSRDYIEPIEIENARSTLAERGIVDPRIRWINWQQIYSMLRRNAKNGNETEQKLVGNLISLLKAKGLSTFDRFEKMQLNNVAQLWPDVAKFLDECSTLFQTVSARLADTNIVTDDRVRFSYRRRSKIEVPVLRWIALRYWDGDKGWQVGRLQCLIILIRLNPLELAVGYRLNFSGADHSLRQVLTHKAQSCALLEKLSSVSNCSVIYYEGDFVPLDTIAANNLSKEAFSPEALVNAENVIIGRVLNPEEMASPKLLDEIVQWLVHMRDIANENGLYLPGEVVENEEEGADSL